MANNFFEELMSKNGQLTEGLNRQQRRAKTKVNEQKTVKKYPVNKFRFESRHIFEETDLDELDAQFAVDPDQETEEGQEDEVVLVIDPEANAEEDIPENAAEEMIGDAVYKCPICGANYVCDCDAVETESIEVDEDGVPTECPICGDDAEQILIGEIAPAEGAGEADELPPVDADDAEDEDDIDDEEAPLINDDDIGDEYEEEDEEEDVIEDSLRRRSRRRMESRRSLPRKQKIKENNVSSKIPSALDNWLQDVAQMTNSISYTDIMNHDYSDEDIKKLQSLKRKWTKEAQYDDDDSSKALKDIGNQVKSILKESRRRVKEDLEDDVEDIDVEDIVADACPECGEAPCVCPVDVDDVDAPTVAIDADNVNLYLDDKRFESMMTKMIRENYHDNPTFKITKVSRKGTQLKLEYVIRERGKTTKGKMVAEGLKTGSRVIRLKFRDRGAFTESFTRTPSMIMECVCIRNKVIPTKLSYDYKVKVNESLYRVVGKVGNSGNFTKATRR